MKSASGKGMIFRSGRMRDTDEVYVGYEKTPGCTTISLGDGFSTMIIVKLNDDIKKLLKEALK